MSAFVKLRELHLEKSVSKARRAGQPEGTCFYRAKPMDLLSLCLLFADFVVLYYSFLYSACLWARSFSGPCTLKVVFVESVRVASFENRCFIRNALISIRLITHFPQTFKSWLHCLQVC